MIVPALLDSDRAVIEAAIQILVQRGVRIPEKDVARVREGTIRLRSGVGWTLKSEGRKC
jgi:hypothetical protein